MGVLGVCRREAQAFIRRKESWRRAGSRDAKVLVQKIFQPINACRKNSRDKYVNFTAAIFAFHSHWNIHYFPFFSSLSP